MLPRSVRHSPNIPYKPYKSFICQLLGSTLHRFIKPLFLRFGEYTSIRLNSFGGGVHFPSKLANDPPSRTSRCHPTTFRLEALMPVATNYDSALLREASGDAVALLRLVVDGLLSSTGLFNT